MDGSNFMGQKVTFWPFWSKFGPFTPGACKPEFAQGQQRLNNVHINSVHVFTKFQKNLMDGSNVMGQKVPFWQFWG